MSPIELKKLPQAPVRFLREFQLPPLKPLGERLSTQATSMFSGIANLRPPPINWRATRDCLKSIRSPALRITGRFTNAACAVGMGGLVYLTATNLPDPAIVWPLSFLLSIPTAGFVVASAKGTLNPFKASSEFFSQENFRPAFVLAAVFASMATMINHHELESRLLPSAPRLHSVQYVAPASVIAEPGPALAAIEEGAVTQTPQMPSAPAVIVNVRVPRTQPENTPTPIDLVTDTAHATPPNTTGTPDTPEISEPVPVAMEIIEPAAIETPVPLSEPLEDSAERDDTGFAAIELQAAAGPISLRLANY